MSTQGRRLVLCSFLWSKRLCDQSCFSRFVMRGHFSQALFHSWIMGRAMWLQSALAALAVWIDSWHFSPISSMPWAWLGHWQYSCKQFWESGMQAWSLLTVESQGFRQLHWWWLMPNFWLVPWRKDAALSIQKRFSKLQCSGIKSHMYLSRCWNCWLNCCPMTIFILVALMTPHGFL